MNIRSLIFNDFTNLIILLNILLTINSYKLWNYYYTNYKNYGNLVNTIYIYLKINSTYYIINYYILSITYTK